MRPLITSARITAIAAGFALAVALPGVAAAQTTSAPTERPAVADRAVERPTVDRADVDIDGIRERALGAIERRFTTLDRLADKVGNSKHLTPDHATGLLMDYASAEAGLSELARQIEQATTPEELHDLIPLIAEDFRVYLVIVPKSQEVAVSDAVVSAAARLSGVAGRLEDMVDRAAAAGWDVEKAREALDTMRGNIDAGNATGGAVAESVIDLDASDWPEPGQEMLRRGRADLVSAGDSLHRAAADGKAVLEALREANPGEAADGPAA